MRVVSSALFEIMVVEEWVRERLGYYIFFHFIFQACRITHEKQRKGTNEPFRLRAFLESERFIAEHWDCFKSHKLTLAEGSYYNVLCF